MGDVPAIYVELREENRRLELRVQQLTERLRHYLRQHSVDKDLLSCQCLDCVYTRRALAGS